MTAPMPTSKQISDHRRRHGDHKFRARRLDGRVQCQMCIEQAAERIAKRRENRLSTPGPRTRDMGHRVEGTPAGFVTQIPKSEPGSGYNGSSPRGAGNTTSGLTHPLDLTKEGLVPDHTRSALLSDETACFVRQLDLVNVEVIARFTIDGDPTSKARAGSPTTARRGGCTPPRRPGPPRSASHGNSSRQRLPTCPTRTVHTGWPASSSRQPTNGATWTTCSN